MKTSKIVLFIACLLTLGTSLKAQEKSEQIPVSGNCGMCESRIEKAAKAGGATSAVWDEDSKLLTVNYDASKTSALKIQQKVAAVGHDTRDVKAPGAVYEKLPGCCKYKKATSAKLLVSSEKDCCEKNEKCCDNGTCCNKSKI